MCHLVATSRVEVKFNKENTNENKYVNLTLGFSINSVETIVDYQTREVQSIYQSLNTELSI